MKKLPKMQRKVLEFIIEHVKLENMPPTIREIGKQFDLKSSTVFYHLQRLEQKGYIARPTSKTRGIKLLFQEQDSLADIPWLGEAPAGEPLLAVENILGYSPIRREMLPKGDYFALRIKGESMIEAGIMDGDFIIVRQQPTAENGQIVVAKVNDEATVKKFYRQADGRIKLQPANSSMEPMVFDPRHDEISIAGEVVFIYRDLSATSKS